MLRRSLGHIQRGFYIDAARPIPTNSVTRLFYDRGRYGINFEPLPFYFEKLAAARLRDLNLNIALSNEPDEVPRLTTLLRALKRRMNV
jgi:hypothetical protein